MRLVFRCLLLYAPSRYEQAAHIGFRSRRFYMLPSGVHPASLGSLPYSAVFSILVRNNCAPSPCKGHYPSRTTTSTPYPCRIFRLQSHSRFFIPPFMRHSWLGHPRLAMRLGKFGFSVSLSLRYHRFSYRLYGMNDNRQAHNHNLPFPYQRFQAIFLHRHITETGSLRSVNPTYTLYPINIAVQSHPIAFG